MKITREEYISAYTKHYKIMGKRGSGIGLGDKEDLLKNCGYKMGSVLDYGCGWGAVSVLFNDGYIGVDIVPQAIEIARKEFPKKTFRLLEIGKLSIPQKDWAIALSVFTHALKSDVQDCLKDIHGNLRDGGTAIVDILEGHGGDIHFRYWEKEDFEKELKRAGFNIKRSFKKKRQNGFTHTYFILVKS